MVKSDLAMDPTRALCMPDLLLVYRGSVENIKGSLKCADLGEKCPTVVWMQWIGGEPGWPPGKTSQHGSM